jgi:hypothetical protein
MMAHAGCTRLADAGQAPTPVKATVVLGSRSDADGLG